jgi:MFS family permease
MDLGPIGTLAALYPATWGAAQLVTGAWSDLAGRKRLIAAGMRVQAAGIAAVVVSGRFAGFVRRRGGDAHDGDAAAARCRGGDGRRAMTGMPGSGWRWWSLRAGADSGSSA